MKIRVPPISETPLTVEGMRSTLRKIEEAIRQHAMLPEDYMGGMNLALDPIRVQLCREAGVDVFEKVPENMVLSDEVIEEFLAVKAKFYDCVAKETVEIEPFHETIGGHIPGASAESFDGIRLLLLQTIVPRNGESIARLCRGKARVLGLTTDLGITHHLLIQQDYFEKNGKKDAVTSVELERLKRIESTILDVLPAIGEMSERLPSSAILILDTFAKADPDGSVGETAKKVIEVISSGEKTTE